MEFDFSQLDVATIYKLMIDAIVPRPIAFVSTVNAAGQGNLAPFSYFTGVASSPPALVLSVTAQRGGGEKDTLRNIRETGQFVVNSSNEWLAEQVNQCSAQYPYGVDEMQKVGLTPVPSRRVKPPRVKESAVHMECELLTLVPVGSGEPGSATLVIGKILLMHVSEEVWKDGRILIDRYQPLARLGGLGYGKTREPFDLPRPKV
jgi:flavin reductase (DIM6/NTAB) family NADH-FMN oxidoreductase RutF